MEIVDLNPHGGIGANCFLAKIGSFRFVIDAGLHPKFIGAEAMPRFKLIANESIDLIFLTHCHLDHLGALPVLAKEHPEASIVCTHPSMILAKRLMHNSCNVMERQREQFGEGSLPLYVHSDVTKIMRNMHPMHMNNPRIFESDSGERITFTLVPSGHVPGATGILFEYQHRKILFSGDVMFKPSRILQGADFPKTKLDTLVIETTRGSTERDEADSRESQIAKLVSTVQETLSHGGSIMIPVFALGRMQEMMAILKQAKVEGKLSDSPIYASGLGVDMVNHFDQISHKLKQLNFSKKIMKELRVQSLPNKHRPGKSTPSIYLLSSGMMVANTPSYNAAAALLGDHRNCICFVGYCDPDTPGGKLLTSKHGEDFLFENPNRTVPIEARIEQFDMSSHADREELLDYIIETNPRSIVLSHGDPSSREWFEAQISELLPATKVFNPKPLISTTV